jgi:mRNA interferase MazF
LGATAKVAEAQALKRGEIFWADLDPRSGSERRGRRPVVIVAHDGFNLAARWRTVIVVPLSTSKAQEERGPTSVPLPSGAGGLARSSFALCHQVTTLDRAKLAERVGALPSSLLAAVDGGLRAAMDLD